MGVGAEEAAMVIDMIAALRRTAEDRREAAGAARPAQCRRGTQRRAVDGAVLRGPAGRGHEAGGRGGAGDRRRATTHAEAGAGRVTTRQENGGGGCGSSKFGAIRHEIPRSSSVKAPSAAAAAISSSAGRIEQMAATRWTIPRNSSASASVRGAPPRRWASR